MNDRKQIIESITGDENRSRRARLAEGAVVFVLVLGLCIYLGVRFAHDPGDDPVAAGTSAAQQASSGLETIDLIAPAGTEPAGVVSSEISGATGETPPLEEVLPGVPLAVTFASAEQTYRAGRFGEAARMFAVYCDEHPGNAWGHYLRGLSLWKADRDQEARAAFDEALAIAPDHLKSLVNLARVELELAEPDAALATIERALDLAPLDVDARRVLGRAFQNLGRPLDAIAAYREALRTKPDDCWTLNNFGLAWIELGQFERALAPLARACELAPDIALIHNNLATALERTGHLAQAREQFQTAGELGSERGEAGYARLAGVEIPAGDLTVDLAVLAAAWTVPAAESEGESETVATASAEPAAATDAR
ncbi:MAG TPA: tetratricopeptide repeat protein [Candidatus Krumholzibacteria bacterium]|nr:tetratricopeptide repeat protein [Candidatus Krumholzibacteria bacterium]HPD70763.1 tetratricopeptide repeat protein [Candidatus Krumholzibacteria bacterium]HRY39537.1 tetratricopeptide repeat protein [Candidatus Krumholzibacteria bacterium]